ncbi:MAG: hypothetical protein JNG83_01685 [Opitutaceae bacterium]|nr:hypothetical protein [Opitutaceae bacterium]
MRLPLLLLLGLLPCAPAVARAGEDWARLRLKMTPEETVAAIGQPLFRSAGKGFELWIYDQQAEALIFAGSLIGWTSPRQGAAGIRSTDIWRENPDRTAFPTFLSQLPAPRVRRPRVDPENATVSYVWLPDYRFGK